MAITLRNCVALQKVDANAFAVKEGTSLKGDLTFAAERKNGLVRVVITRVVPVIREASGSTPGRVGRVQVHTVYSFPDWSDDPTVLTDEVARASDDMASLIYENSSTVANGDPIIVKVMAGLPALTDGGTYEQLIVESASV